MGVGSRGISILLLVGVSAGCGGDRARPTEPGTDDGPALSEAPLVEIVDPTEGSRIPRQDFTEGPGRRVVLEGRFIPGHQLLLEGFALQYGPIPFHTEVYDVEEEGVRAIHFLRANVFHLDGSTDARIRVRVFDEGTLISRDSVQIELR